MRKGKKMLAAVLISALLLSALGGCTAESQTSNSRQEETIVHEESVPEAHNDDNVNTKDKPEHTAHDNSEEVKTGLQSFSAELFKMQYEAADDKTENVFLSPFSVYSALSMLQNGAKGDTAKEMETVLGSDTKKEKDFFKKYISGLLQNENSSFSVANSLWINDESSAKVKPVFIQNAEKSYNAEVFFDKANAETANKINQWASDNTKGMIPNILKPDDLNESTVVVLLNAVCFDAKWLEEYSEDDVTNMTFNNYDSTAAEIPFMHSTEHSYIEDENAEGFVKYYLNEDNADDVPRYAFVAILPKNEVSIDDYVSQYYQADTISSLADNAKNEKVNAAMPKFKFDTEYELPAVLRAMGLNLIFDKENADLKDLAEDPSGNVSVNRVIHKAFIEVDEHGTKAAAVTAIDAVTNGAVMPEEVHTVVLDRPFMFAIYDCEEHIPLFTGVYKTAEQ